VTLPIARLAAGRDGPFRAGHPWVFSGALVGVSPSPADAAEVRVVDAGGAFIARGLYNRRSQIRVRLYRWEDAPLDAAFLATRIREAIGLRRGTLGLDAPEGACRLVFSEGDGLSGLTVDRYGPYLSLQLTSLALAARLEEILDVLVGETSAEGVVLRTERGILAEEGLELTDGPVRGSIPEVPFEILERDLRFTVDLRAGQKTGFYLDQRYNRHRAARFADGRTVADVCCYTGGFGVTMARAGASAVVGVDVSRRALELASSNAELNGVSESMRFERSDAFIWLEAEALAGRRYGMIVLDPPRLARTRKGVPQALQGYERLNGLALSCLEPGGILVTCSCSGRVGTEDFQGAVARGALRAGRRVRILERLGQSADHPVSTACPETAYLKCLICHAS
jgi:23S rRNA (cytosine1962-C5)-methyltransferase